ncbi:MAG TPA: inositol monophosphatase family protein [Chitinophagales bacterium]|nr:inositol monophosphatase family protein [Chitinophagales bacterium]
MKIQPEFIQSVIEIAENVADFIQSHAGKINDQQIITKDLNSLVSFVDTGSEERIIEGLKKITPKAGFLAEEGTETVVENELIWIIDPLDGTTNFLHQIPTYAISLALQYQNEIIFGLVYEVNKKDCFYAVKDGGAFLNGKKIQVNTASFADSLIATGFPYYDFSKTNIYLGTLEELMRNTRGIRRLGAAAVDLAYVACGKFSGFFEYSLAPWDVAAGALIVQEAGGIVTDFNGGQDWLHGKSIIVGSPIVQNKLLEIIRSKS